MRQPQRKHLMGGTLKTAMVEEIKRVLAQVGGHRETAAFTLGISVRTLEKWLKQWEELKSEGGMEQVLAAATTITKSKSKKKTKAKTAAKKKTTKSKAEARVA